MGKTSLDLLTAGLEEIGRTARRQRRQLGLTQAELAGLCGVGVRFVSELEAGKPTLEIGRALHVLHHLGLELRVDTRRTRAHDGQTAFPA